MSGTRVDLFGGEGPRRAWRGMLVAAALLSAGVRVNAQEFRLFPAGASGPRYFSSFDVGAAGFRI
ncbi:MAG TPA: hypothetical protein VN032_09820, partial [Thermoanaerobaculia bacterium]|nr:hypothetical protein [Thermoanaerobaculia bacterium]